MNLKTSSSNEQPIFLIIICYCFVISLLQLFVSDTMIKSRLVTHFNLHCFFVVHFEKKRSYLIQFANDMVMIKSGTIDEIPTLYKFKYYLEKFTESGNTKEDQKCHKCCFKIVVSATHFIQSHFSDMSHFWL